MKFVMTSFVLLVSQQVFAEQTLCRSDEKVVFSCHVGLKLLSLCETTARRKTLEYRFGTEKQIELKYPGDKAKPLFYTQSFPLYGGGVTYVGFANGQYEYKIYSKNSRIGGSEDEQVPVAEDGVVILKNGKEIKKLVCDDGGEGFRDSVNWLPSRK